MWERPVGKQVGNCTLASKKWGVLEALLQMTPIRAAFVCSKACDIVAEDAFSVASQHSISLVDIKWGTVMSPQSRCVTLLCPKFPSFFPSEIPACWNRMFWKELARNIKYRGKLQGVPPPKTNMEPENGPLEKEIPFGNHPFQVPC